MAAHARVNLFRSHWHLELVAQSLLGVCRFDDFHEQLGISRQVLAQRLKELVAEEILVRQQYQSRPDRYEYTLTAKGRDLLPVLVEMTAWSERWRPHAPRAARRDMHTLSHGAEQTREAE
jgi:DNA-binding HxlR family transcriptional regulator